ncbi:MAG TPA: FlgD immunoglobulin-like domain containing protein [Candidatus Cloacimonadota bacterium]|nr:FlgD immunoglobulin-like domain containing protein [Candidatus Cloacimonadota bacterium]
MKSAAYRLAHFAVVTSFVLMLGIFCGLYAQELPYTVYGPQGGNHGNDNSTHYSVSGMLTVGDVCYYLRRTASNGLMISHVGFDVGYLLPDASTSIFSGVEDPRGYFLTRLADSVVFGDASDSAFRWRSYNFETGNTDYPYTTFDEFDISTASPIEATAMDENHILVIFGNPHGNVVYASCMDLNYNEIWGFPLGDLISVSHSSPGRVYALDSQRFLYFNYNSGQLFTLNSAGVIENQTTAADLFQTNIPGTFLAWNRLGNNSNELSKYENNTFSPLFTISDQDVWKFLADADSSSIVVMFQKSNQTNELRKYDWDGNLIWSQVLPWPSIYDYDDNLAINANGSIYLAMYDSTMWRYIFAKVLADGSHTFTSNEDPTASPEIPALSAYPNPFSKELNLNLLQESKGSYDVSIYNLKGQLVRYCPHLETKTDSPDWCWDGKDERGKEVPNGIYLIRAQSAGVIQHTKCLKVH